MKHQTKLSLEQQHAAQHQTQQPAAREFANVEELLRHDAAQTPMPPGLAQRLQKSTGELPGPKAAWWKRWFGGTQP